MKFGDNFPHSRSTSRIPRALPTVGSISVAVHIASVCHSSSQAHQTGLLSSARSGVIHPSSPRAPTSSSKSQIATRSLRQPQPSPSSPPVSVCPGVLLGFRSYALKEKAKKKKKKKKGVFLDAAAGSL
ncbi:hypothetical protein TIFTF001_003833 [Ficus carica]|uniref:Uncharacterized protein n=1 Tax=Ficus carica TaxID=3494 RepID=A0AA87ZIS6_FICCA|nr:hypothetical protein TIFTF001_003833 [Ficus carica]